MSRYRSSRGFRRSGPPAWLIFLVGVALVFGFFYLWDGLQRFIRTDGLGVIESTQRAQLLTTATAERATRVLQTRTLMPTATPLPQCQDFRVTIVDAPTALVREAPNPSGRILDAFAEGTIVCVLWRDAGSEYYTVDADPTTRRYELAYMHESVLEAVNPTATPSITPTPPPTITLTPTLTLQPGQVQPSPQSAQPTMPAAPTRRGDDVEATEIPLTPSGAGG